MSEQLENVREWLRRALSDPAVRTVSISADEARELLAFTEPVPGELGEAMEAVQGFVDECDFSERPNGVWALVNISPKMGEHLSAIVQALREALQQQGQPIPPGELADAVLYVKCFEAHVSQWVKEFGDEAPGEAEWGKVAAAIRTVLAALQQHQVALALAGEPVVQARTATTGGDLPEQPEADPELVGRMRARTTKALKAVLADADRSAASIRQVLHERGETDGNAG